jgi:hypothetical protein
MAIIARVAFAVSLIVAIGMLTCGEREFLYWQFSRLSQRACLVLTRLVGMWLLTHFEPPHPSRRSFGSDIRGNCCLRLIRVCALVAAINRRHYVIIDLAR